MILPDSYIGAFRRELVQCFIVLCPPDDVIIRSYRRPHRKAEHRLWSQVACAQNWPGHPLAVLPQASDLTSLCQSFLTHSPGLLLVLHKIVIRVEKLSKPLEQCLACNKHL